MGESGGFAECRDHPFLKTESNLLVSLKNPYALLLSADDQLSYPYVHDRPCPEEFPAVWLAFDHENKVSEAAVNLVVGQDVAVQQ